MRNILLPLAISAFALTGASAQDVPIPCDPATCPPIDPCKLAPERCKPPGGPIPEPEPKPEPKPDPKPEPEPNREG